MSFEFDLQGLKPMLIGSSSKAFSNDDYLFEIKFDGARTLIYCDKNSFHLINKRGVDLTRYFPELSYYCDKSVIFDAEIVVFKNDKVDFNAITKRLLNKDVFKAKISNDKASLMIFDILYYDGNLLIDEPLIDRKKLLSKIFKPARGIYLVEYLQKEGEKLYELAKSLGLEGIVGKRLDSLYQPGKRVSTWIKIKNLLDEEFVVVYYRVTENGYCLGLAFQNELKYVGEVPYYSSIDHLIKSRRYEIEGFKNKKKVIYVKPSALATVKFMDYTKNMHLRQPIFKSWYRES